jgi:hypothetical protein
MGYSKTLLGALPESQTTGQRARATESDVLLAEEAQQHFAGLANSDDVQDRDRCQQIGAALFRVIAAARAVAHPPNDNLLRRMAAVEATNGVDVGMPPGAVVLTDQMDSPFPCVKCGRDTGKDAQRLYGAVCHPTCESRPTSAGHSTGGESNAGE